MHFQFPPAAETKLVRCTRGAILDIIVDLRPESPTYLQHIAVELNEDNQRALYVPERFAHGYQALRDNTDTSYQVGEFYTPGAEGGLMYNDPRLGLKWPLPVAVISDKDQKFELLDEIEPEVKRRMARERGHGERVTMILVDTALQERQAQGKPIRVGIVGAGFMCQGLTNQIVEQHARHARGCDLQPQGPARGRRLRLCRPRGCRRRRHAGRARRCDPRERSRW